MERFLGRSNGDRNNNRSSSSSGSSSRREARLAWRRVRRRRARYKLVGRCRDQPSSPRRSTSTQAASRQAPLRAELGHPRARCLAAGHVLAAARECAVHISPCPRCGAPVPVPAESRLWRCRHDGAHSARRGEGEIHRLRKLCKPRPDSARHPAQRPQQRARREPSGGPRPSLQRSHHDVTNVRSSSPGRAAGSSAQRVVRRRPARRGP